jgi:protein SCO1/2
MSESASQRRKLLLVCAAGAVVLCLLGGLFAYASSRLGGRGSGAEMYAQRAGAADGKLPELWEVPAFSFRDQNGRTQTNETLRGRVLIGDFIFTTCTTVCPLLSAKMRLLQRALPEAEVGFVSFSVDPAHDTPEALANYARSWSPGESRWTLLSTDATGLAALASGMKVAVEPSSDRENPIIHSSLFFLIDRGGKVRGFYDSSDELALQRLVTDTKTLLGSTEAAAPSAKSGAELYADLGCAACHANPKLAPPLGGIRGRSVTLQSGETVAANREYLRESLSAPGQKLVGGYLNLMPAYDGALSSAELERVVDFLETMPAAAPVIPSANSAPSAAAVTPAASARPSAVTSPPMTPNASAPAASPAASLQTDPVCKMTVRAAPDSLQETHAGHTYYFCSPGCRDAFRANPAKYAHAQ